MKKILLSLSMIGAVAVVAIGATGAFFSDTETSTGNTFTAGAIDLKVDSECHYYNYVGGTAGPNEDGYVDVGCTENDLAGENGYQDGNWTETDLGAHKFFKFSDLKPGDKGEDTISLHVYNNDAWGKISMGTMISLDNSCTEPETKAEVNCNPTGDGELLGAMLRQFSMWLDQGEIPGFQNGGAVRRDETEGDNVLQPYEGEPWRLEANLELSEVLAAAYNNGDCDATEGDDPLYSADGHNNYGTCHGLAEDGRMVGSTTYYLGLAWELPLGTGNEVQTDSLSGDVTFEVEQHRNNPRPFDI